LPWIEANGASIHYKLEGKTGPTVILLHEIGGSLDSWDGIVPELSKKTKVFRYDQRGFGLSEKVRAQYSIETLVDDLQALEFQARNRAGVGSLVFCNPAPGVDPARAGALENVAALAEKDGIRGIIPLMLDKSYPPSLSDKETYENYRGRYIANDPVGFGLAFRMMARTNMAPLLAGITCPTLVVAGRQDAIRAVLVTEGIAKQIPGAQFEIIDAGHFMPTTSPGALLALLKDFWKV